MVKNRITVIVLGVLSVLELVITKELNGTIALWVLYGVYKVIS